MKPRHTFSPLYRALAALLVSGSFSLAHQAQASDDDALQALQALLQAQTELVTKTKLNADYVPGSISVLHGQDLRRYGARTLSDAIGMAPGIEVQRNHMGQSILVMRGLGTPFSGGTVKLMLNDVNMVSSASGLAAGILNMPLDQVERVEIIRGAASVLHGDFAYAGVVNVVTHVKGEAALASGSNGYNALNVGQRFYSKGDSWSLALHVGQWMQDKSQTRVGDDMLTQADKYIQSGLGSFSQAPGVINDRHRFRQLNLDWQKNDHQIFFNLLENKSGDYFGIIEFLPEDTRDYNQTHQDIMLGYKTSAALNSQLNYAVNINWQQRQYDLNTLYTSVDVPFMQGTPYEAYAYRRPIQNQYTEQVGHISGHLVYEPNPYHRLLLGAELERYEITQARVRNLPTARQNITERFGSSGDARNVMALYVQDEWRPIDPFTLTLGLRAQKSFINYQDITQGDRLSDPFRDLEQPNLTPKVAAVYRVTDQHILKAQYSQSMVTPPIHQVVNVGRSKRPQTTQTDHYELGYIFNSATQVHRFTGFYSEYDNLPKGTLYYDYLTGSDRYEVKGQPYRGLQNVISQGLEWDSEFRLSSRVNGFANAAWLHTYDKETHKAVVGSTQHLANLGLMYSPNGDWTMTSRINYIGERHREPYDPRSRLAAFNTVDFNIQQTGWVKGLTLNLGINNAFDTQVRYPAPINGELSDAAPEPVAAYPQDYPAMGRQIWVKARYQF